MLSKFDFIQRSFIIIYILTSKCDAHHNIQNSIKKPYPIYEKLINNMKIILMS